MSLWKEPPTASCREKPGPADTLLAVASATSSDFVMIEFQVSISILIPTTPERMPRDSDGARIEDGKSRRHDQHDLRILACLHRNHALVLDAGPIGLRKRLIPPLRYAT